MEPTTDSASAPNPTPTLPASIAASEAGDFGAFREAARAEKQGTPLPAVAAKPAAETPEAVDKDATPVEVKPVSKRQEKANDAVRTAVDRATIELREEVARLRAQLPKEPEQKTEPAKATPKRFVAMPDAPKLADFNDSDDPIAEHAAAMSEFVFKTLRAEESAKQAIDRDVQQATKQIETFQSQIAEAGGPDFLDALSPEVKGLRPVEALHAQGESAKVGPRNVLASHIVKSARAPQLLQYLHDHPDALKAFDACATVGDTQIEIGKLEARVDSPMSATPTAKTVTSATAPPSTLSTARSGAASDPEKAAVTTGDFRAFRAARAAKQTPQRA